MAKSWKDALLSSGLPLEAEVKRYLESRSCISHFEYSYLRPDENAVERQFSYDIDAAYIPGRHYFSMMIECKYRYPGTKWFFLPGEYGGPEELFHTDFLHPFDHFVEPSFGLRSEIRRPLAPVCEKGIELVADDKNQKSIRHAINQLAYAFSQHVASAIEHQVEKLLVEDHIFYHVPIIVTTADLYRVKPGAGVEEIRAASDPEDVSSQEDLLVVSHNAGAELSRYNWQVLQEARQSLGDTKIKSSMNSFTEDLDHLLSVISSNYCPRALVVASVANGWQSLDRLFNYIDMVIEPPTDLLKEIQERSDRLRETGEQLFSQEENSHEP